jgi:nucleoside-diphosphate-sugar epimerase
MEHQQMLANDREFNKDDLIVIAGAGGFIAGNLVLYFKNKGLTRIRSVDKKPVNEWYLGVPGVESFCLNLSKEENCRRVCEGAAEVYNLAADMGGMGLSRRAPSAPSNRSVASFCRCRSSRYPP